MMKMYFISVAIYFVIFIVEGLLFKKKFKKGQEIINMKKLEDEEKYSKKVTTLVYLVISFIIVIRTIVLIGKLITTFKPEWLVDKNMKRLNDNNKFLTKVNSDLRKDNVEYQYKIKELEEEINNLKKEKKNLKRKYTILEKEINNGTN